ncbi:hypothetical protein NUU61_001632 [Penicillium alfredii]|uniref:Uncharacterized protein n=1 Tax=Penicillium alfredii TaxID=1506179 RepID=A0A9W9FQP4_9EURO|nr:uncharacterized protein NUU61_001632 [Penicillium alfredii]KAJ5104285.1 hypothetical protein NUU61_001632 [Penicillium alfredii]
MLSLTLSDTKSVNFPLFPSGEPALFTRLFVKSPFLSVVLDIIAIADEQNVGIVVGQGFGDILSDHQFLKPSSGVCSIALGIEGVVNIIGDPSATLKNFVQAVLAGSFVGQNLGEACHDLAEHVLGALFVVGAFSKLRIAVRGVLQSPYITGNSKCIRCSDGSRNEEARPCNLWQDHIEENKTGNHDTDHS